MIRFANFISDVLLRIAIGAGILTGVVLLYRVIFQPDGKADFYTGWLIYLASAVGWALLLGVILWFCWCARFVIRDWVREQVASLEVRISRRRIS